MDDLANSSIPVCPYVGLQPYTQADREYFFGRDQDIETIAANLLTTPLTLLYGASGVGKTSVLAAGVVPYLRALPKVLVVVFKTWTDRTFQAVLVDSIAREINDSTGRPIAFDAPLALDEFLRRAAEQTQRTLLIIFDQFEEYFLYHPNNEPFDEQFARAVNREDTNVNFLLSLREDALSQIDRFESRIPNLMSNYLRLEHLDRASAVSAIRKPLDVYNLKRPGEPPFGIEDALVDVLIEQVQTGRVRLGQRAGQGQVASPASVDPRDVRIETPFLQMVLTRLWDEEVRTGSQVLKLETLNRLGGAEKIVRTHLDDVMTKLTPAEREVCSSFFDRLVTPSGTKIAQNADDLVAYAGRSAARVTPVLKKLADARVLRPIAPPIDQPQTARYEIFHDVLAPGILDWRGRYSERKRTRRLRLTLLGASLIILVIAVLSILALLAGNRASAAEAQAQYLQREADAAESRRLAIQSAVNREKNYPLALLLGIEAIHSDDNVETKANLFDTLMSKSQLTTNLQGPAGYVWSVAFSPDSLVLASGGSSPSASTIDKPLILWDLTAQPPTGVTLMANGSGVRAVAFSPDGRLLASGSVNDSIQLWDVATRQPSGEALKGHGDQINSLAFSPDGKILASGDGNGVIIFWNLSTHQPIGEPLVGSKQAPITAVVFEPDGGTLASSSEDGTINFWRTNDHRPIGQPLTGSKDGVLSLAYSPDGRTLASGSGNADRPSSDNTIILWNVDTQQPIGKPFVGHTGGVWSIAFSGDGTVLISGSQDRTVIVWDANGHVPVLPPYSVQKDTVSSVAFSPNGKLFASGSWDGTIVLWDTDENSWITRACKSANRNLTLEEWKQYSNADASTYRVTCPDLPPGN